MADEGFGDVLRDLAQRKLHWPPARRGLGAQLHRLIELQGAQIDATLCFFTTLSLYGLLRHLAAGPAFGGISRRSASFMRFPVPLLALNHGTVLYRNLCQLTQINYRICTGIGGADEREPVCQI